MFRKWCVFGCLVVSAVGCKSSKQSELIGPQAVDNTKLVNMPLTGSTKKSFWGGGSSTPPPSMPVEVVSEASAKKPASAEALVAIADVQLESAFDEKTAPGSKEGLLDAARKGYQKALQQEPKSKAALRGMAGFYARLGERERAVEMYKKYLKLYPKDAEMAHEVAVAHARWKDWSGAVAWCDYTLKVDPENRTAKKTMGFCLARAGKWDEAYDTLCQIMPEAQARHNLAGLLDHMGYTDASKIQLQLAVKADPKFAPAVGFLAELEHPQPDPNAIQQASDTQPEP